METLSVPLQTVIDGVDVSGRPAGADPRGRIVKPTDAETSLVVRASSFRICNNCYHFNFEGGRTEIARQRFWERLRHEQGWRQGEKWYGQEASAGICEARGLVTTAPCPADPDPRLPGSGCDEWRPSVKRIVFSGIKRIVGSE